MAEPLNNRGNDAAELDRIRCEGQAEEVDRCPFVNIPVEVFLHICSFLDSRLLSHTLSKVCRRFSAILSDEFIWKSRIERCVAGNYPALPINSVTFDWGYACSLLEDECNLWRNKEETMRKIVLQDVHKNIVYAVLLSNCGNLCFSGSGDGSLAAWNLNEAVLEGPTPKAVIPRAHKGEIRDLTSLQDKLYSCSWNGSLKSWDVEKELKELCTYHANPSARRMASEANIIAVGHYDESVVLFDPRVPRNTASYRIHTGVILDLTMMNSYIVSASSDNTFAVWDLRNHRQLIKIPLYTDDLAIHGCPTSVSYSNGILYIGDSIGNLHLIDPTGGKFNTVEKVDVGHGFKIHGVKHSLGSVLTCFSRGLIQIAAPTRPLEPITVIETQGNNVTKFDYKEHILAMGSYKKLVEVWLPKSMHN